MSLSRAARLALISKLSKAYQSPTATVTGSGRAGTTERRVKCPPRPSRNGESRLLWPLVFSVGG